MRVVSLVYRVFCVFWTSCVMCLFPLPFEVLAALLLTGSFSPCCTPVFVTSRVTGASMGLARSCSALLHSLALQVR